MADRKNILILVFLILGMGTSTNAGAVSSQVTMTQMSLKTCNSKKCIEMTALRAESSHFNPLYSLVDVKLVLIDLDSQKIRTLEGPMGYLDFNQDLVVVTRKDQSDYLISLRDLSEKDFSK
jgi:hypothetical protein